MKLTFDQICAAARGVAYATQEDGRVRLHRFTAAQEAMYEACNAEHYDRSFATAGVVLEFDTDSQTLSLAVRCRKGSSRHWFVHSVFVNDERIGQLSGSYTPPETVDAACTWPLGEGSKRVKILFPWSAGSEILALELSDGASFAPVRPEKRALIYGDSITQGYDASLPELSYAHKLAEHLGFDCINKAIGGEVFRPDFGKLKDDITPEIITVAYGTNDWSRKSRETYSESVEGFFAALRENYPQAPILILAPIWRLDWQKEKPFGPFREIPEILEAAAQRIGNARVIDCFDFIPQEKQNLRDDGIHPNDRGFAIYAEELLRNL